MAINTVPTINTTPHVSTFVPLERHSGTSIQDFLHLHPGKDIIIWGAGMLGRCLMHRFKSSATPEQSLYFTDSNPKLHSTFIDNNLVIEFEQALQSALCGSAVIVVAVAGHMKTATSCLTGHGLKRSINFESYLKLSRPEALIQISKRSGDHVENMTLNTYRSVLAKLGSDIPDLFHLDLSGWGEPLDNPCLPEIIHATRLVVPCTITTRLMVDVTAIEQALYAAPTHFVVSVDGFEISYQVNTPEGNWDIFIDRLRHVSAIKEKLQGKTEIRLKYNVYKNNNGIDADAMRSLCEQLGIKMVKAIGYIDPYDVTLHLCESGAVFSNTSSLTNKLSWSLKEALSLATSDKEYPCLCQRIFPVIHSDCSVGICHLYENPRIHNQYLAADYDVLQHLRLEATHCRVCQRYALHRLDIDVLQSRHDLQLMQPEETAHA